MKLTKKFIKENAGMTLKEAFPEVFEKPTGYYKHRDEYPNWICYFDLENKTYYGIGVSGIWIKCEGKDDFNEMRMYIKNNCMPSTPQEIQDALEKEAVRRYSGKLINPLNAHIMCGYSGNGIKLSFKNTHLDSDGRLWISEDFEKWNCIVFDNGVWAQIIQTITKQEAEERLGMKII